MEPIFLTVTELNQRLDGVYASAPLGAASKEGGIFRGVITNTQTEVSPSSCTRDTSWKERISRWFRSFAFEKQAKALKQYVNGRIPQEKDLAQLNELATKYNEFIKEAVTAKYTPNRLLRFFGKKTDMVKIERKINELSMTINSGVPENDLRKVQVVTKKTQQAVNKVEERLAAVQKILVRDRQGDQGSSSTVLGKSKPAPQQKGESLPRKARTQKKNSAVQAKQDEISEQTALQKEQEEAHLQQGNISETIPDVQAHNAIADNSDRASHIATDALPVFEEMTLDDVSVVKSEEQLVRLSAEDGTKLRGRIHTLQQLIKHIRWADKETYKKDDLEKNMEEFMRKAPGDLTKSDALQAEAVIGIMELYLDEQFSQMSKLSENILGNIRKQIAGMTTTTQQQKSYISDLQSFIFDPWRQNDAGTRDEMQFLRTVQRVIKLRKTAQELNILPR